MNRRAALESMANGLSIALEGLRQIMNAPDPEDWVDQKSSPLGRRRHCELARAGVFPSARKVDGSWYARRKDIDAYIEGHAPPVATSAPVDAEEAEILAYRAPVRRRKTRSAA